eukprot:scaffold7074_cov256-Pinguiococcus_pyrenoidosus.AAC.4
MHSTAAPSTAGASGTHFRSTAMAAFLPPDWTSCSPTVTSILFAIRRSFCGSKLDAADLSPPFPKAS